jgi:ubiquinone/menaquinone biosynthesis C-methylase UbiE
MNWKKDYIDILKRNNFKQIVENDVFVWTAKIEDTLATSFHKKMPNGAVLRKLQNVRLHLAYWETPYYKKAIERFTSEFVNPADCLAVDIGCGDGRFTEFLLKKGFGKVIAIDAHLTPLLALANYAKENGLSERLLIIHSLAQQLPLPSCMADLVLAIEVFYYLNKNFNKALQEASRILKKNGLLINSEPDLEGIVYKSVIFDKLGDVIENFENHHFKEEKGKTYFKFRLFTKSEIRKYLTKVGLEVENFHGISLLPLILRIKMVRDEISQDELKKRENRIQKIIDYFDSEGVLSSFIIWKSRKI